MATHASAAKRARQSTKRADRNSGLRSRVHRAEKAVREAIQLKDPAKIAATLKAAFSTIQKSKGAIHRNAIMRKMARLSKAALLKKAN